MGQRVKDLERYILETEVVGECLISHKQPRKRYPSTRVGRLNRLILAWKLARNLKRGELATHTCGVARCLRPEHIVSGSVTSNNRDTVEHGHHRAWQAKLTPKQRIACAKEYLKGYASQLEIAAQFGVGQVSVSIYARKLKANQRWDGLLHAT